jgi:transcriptional regulator
VRRMEADGLLGQLTALSELHEGRVSEGEPWTIDKLPETRLRGLLAAIVGFELEVLAWRETVKLGQNKSVEDRMRVANGLEAEGSPAIAQLIRTLAP